MDLVFASWDEPPADEVCSSWTWSSPSSTWDGPSADEVCSSWTWPSPSTTWDAPAVDEVGSSWTWSSPSATAAARGAPTASSSWTWSSPSTRSSAWEGPSSSWSWPSLPTSASTWDGPQGAAPSAASHATSSTFDDSADAGDLHSDPWSFRRELWSAPPPHAMGFIQSAEELAGELDSSDGVSWMLYTQDADEAAECLDLVKAAKNDEASHGITVLLDLPRERLPDWVDDCEHTTLPVPGTLRGKLSMRALCVVTAGFSPATLDSRRDSPLVVAQPPADLHAQRASAYVVRLTFDRAYCGDLWGRVLKSPGQFARTWIGAHGIAQLAIVDTFGFAQVGNARVSGLVRLQHAEDAHKLWTLSGFKAGNLVYFVDVIGSNRAAVLKEDVAVTWVPWQLEESYEAYHSRVCKGVKLGLVLGRGLGQRVLTSDPAYKKQPTVWRARAVPENYSFGALQPVLAELGFQDPVAVSFYKQRKGKVWSRDWCFRATRSDRQQVAERPVQWGSGHTAEFVVLREHARRMQHAPHQPLAASRTATFADFATDTPASKPKQRGRKTPPAVQPVKGETEVKAPAPADHAEVPADSKGSKRAAAGDDESAAPFMDLSSDRAGADWAPNAPLVDNDGGGNYLALATLDLGGKPRNHRQLRRFVSQCLQDFEKECKQAWLQGGSYNCLGRLQACS